MRFLKLLQKRWIEKNARFWGKECARVMLLTSFVKKNQYQSTAPTYAWIARQAMLTRTHWVQLDGTTMLHDRSGQTVDIPEDSNLRFAIQKVIEIEYGYEISNLMQPWECAEMLREAYNAADKYLDKQSGSGKCALACSHQSKT